MLALLIFQSNRESIAMEEALFKYIPTGLLAVLGFFVKNIHTVAHEAKEKADKTAVKVDSMVGVNAKVNALAVSVGKVETKIEGMEKSLNRIERHILKDE